MCKVLIVENDLELKVLYRAAIDFQRYEVLMTETIGEAQPLITIERPSLAVIDTNCVDFDILERNQLNIPLFLLTNIPEKDSTKLAEKYGAVLALNPLDGSLGKLIKEIRKVLA